MDQPTDRPVRVPWHALSVVAIIVAVLAAATTGLAAPAAQPVGQPCRADVDKTAAPGRIPLGDEVTVTLRVDGVCPEVAQQAEVMLVMDASWSMTWDGKIDAARQSAVTFVRAMDPALVRIGLISFYSVAVVEQPLTTDQARLVERIGDFPLDRGTNLVDALDLAARELSGAGLRPDANRVIVFITDGRHFMRQPPLSALDPVIARARAAGIEVFTIGLGRDADVSVLTRMATSPAHFYFSPSAPQLEGIFLRIAGRIKAQELFVEAKVTDRVPANMTYVPSSGDPLEPTVSADGRTLSWRLVRVREPGLTLRYRLQPQEVGVWPTNVEAHLDYTDGFGHEGRRTFPVPEVEVVDTPEGLCVCDIVRQRVPEAVVEEILAHPERTYGWQYPLDPGKPRSPANPPRQCLTLQNVNIDYHPLWNPPIWRLGCP